MRVFRPRRVKILAVMTAVLLPLSTVTVAQADDQPGKGAGRPDVQITAPTHGEPFVTEDRLSLEVSFTANREWPYKVEFRLSIDGDEGWKSFEGEEAEGSANDGENTIQVTVPEGVAEGHYDIRLRLFTPGPRQIERAADTADALRIVGYTSHDYDDGQVDASGDGMVAAAEPHAADAGSSMLDEGGNAVDAATATAFALAVVEPTMSGLGGRTNMVIRDQAGEYVGIQGGTEVPSNFEPLDPPPPDGSRGYGTIGIPGTVAALVEAQQSHGELALEEVMEPAIELAAEGFELSSAVAGQLADAAESDRLSEGANEYFLKEDGTTYVPGEMFVQSDLAEVLEAIAEEGATVFYEGWIAEAIEEDMSDNDGFLNQAELASYESQPHLIINGEYRGDRLVSAFRPTSGHQIILGMQMMEEFDANNASEGAWASILHQAHHLTVREANSDPGDSEEESAEIFSSNEYAKGLAEEITDHGALRRNFDRAAEYPDEHTTHLTTADADGGMVALTQSLGPNTGSGVASPGLGFLYASTMGYAAGDEADTPGARPRTRQSPTIVERDGEPLLALGGAGGAHIISAILVSLSRTLDEGRSFAEAVAAPRQHEAGAQTIQLESDPEAGVGWSDAAIDQLQQWDYTVQTESPSSFGRVHGIHYDAHEDKFTGVADPRGDGQASGP